IFARQNEIEARLQVLRRGDKLAALVVVGRGQQFSRPFQRWRSANQFLPLVIVQRLGTISLFVQERVPVVSNYAEMKIREIPIAHLDLWPRRIPDALGVNVKRLGF